MRDGVGFVTLTGAERKNPLTFASYAALRDTFRELAYDDDVDAVVIAGEAGNFCSGGDVRDIIGPLTEMDMRGLLRFTRMTGDLVKAIRGCPQPVIAAIDGVCVGAGAMIATACRPAPRDAAREGRVPVHARRARRLRHGRVRDAAAHHRPGARGRAALHGPLDGRRGGRALGLLQPPGRADVEDAAAALAASLAGGPTFAHAMTKTMLDQEWDMSVAAAIEAEAQAQAICMQTQRLRARLPRVPRPRSARCSRATD